MQWIIEMALFVCFCGFPNLPFQKQDFSCSGGPKWDPPVTFELKVREQNQLGFWNISIRPTSGASFIKIGRPTFSTSGTLSQTMTLTCKHWCIIETSSGPPRNSSAIFGNFWEMFGNVRLEFENFWKVVENLLKIIENTVIRRVCFYKLLKKALHVTCS